LNKKWFPYVLIIALGLLLFLVRNFQRSKSPDPKPDVTHKVQPKDPASQPDRDHGFDRRTGFIQYSNHARCRMECRHISQEEVKEIMQRGTINYNKSDLQNARCPRYALEGRTKDDQRVRIIFAQCNESTTVVTVIDLDTEFTCHCPGDDDKYKNRN